MLTFGLVINPYAGIGGAVGLKGSDHMVEEAFRRGAEQKAMARAHQALAALASEQQPFQFITCPGDMGQSVLEALNYPHRVLPMSVHSPTCAEDTRQAVKLMVQQDIDVLVFAGGDGTARDILQALDEAGKSQVAYLSGNICQYQLLGFHPPLLDGLNKMANLRHPHFAILSGNYLILSKCILIQIADLRLFNIDQPAT
jgi:hypothetical protein